MPDIFANIALVTVSTVMGGVAFGWCGNQQKYNFTPFCQ
jgi:hypothetical protein